MSAHNDTALPPLDEVNFANVTYFIHQKSGAMEKSQDPYRRDYVSFQDFCVLREALAAAEAKLAEVEKERDAEVKGLIAQLKKCVQSKKIGEMKWL